MTGAERPDAKPNPDGSDSHARGSWRTGRPSRRTREAVEALLPEDEKGRHAPRADRDLIQDWIRERTFYDLFDRREDGSR